MVFTSRTTCMRASRARQSRSEAMSGLAELADAVTRDGVEHGVVFANSIGAADGEGGMSLRALRDQRRQIAPQVAALAKEHRHDGDTLRAICGQISDGARQIGRHQFEKG